MAFNSLLFICSKFSRDYYVDVSDFTANISHQQRKAFPNRKDLLFIALFDIWLANEDRNHNNYNLLINIEIQRDFIPIDHETILNSRILDMPLSELTYEDSIISSPLFLNLFGVNDLIVITLGVQKFVYILGMTESFGSKQGKKRRAAVKINFTNQNYHCGSPFLSHSYPKIHCHA